MTPKTKRRTAATESVSSQDGFSLISNQKLVQLYATMLKYHMLEERMKAGRSHNLAKQSEPGGHWHLTSGREAATVGVLIDLVSEDTVVSAPGSLVPRFVKGLPLNEMFEALNSPAAAPSQAGPWLQGAIIAAEAHKENKNKKIAVAFSGRGAATSLSWKNALAHALLHRLPMIFVSWNPLRAHPMDFPTIAVDGDDVVAVYRVASESIAHARQGLGPTLIECKRWQGPGPVLNPIRNMEKYLTRKGLFNAVTKAEIAADFQKELDATFAMDPK
jgi:TPP-dependent pyruvate/acetoin dehydrogenase alpha subunit